MYNKYLLISSIYLCSMVSSSTADFKDCYADCMTVRLTKVTKLIGKCDVDIECWTKQGAKATYCLAKCIFNGKKFDDKNQLVDIKAPTCGEEKPKKAATKANKEKEPTTMESMMTAICAGSCDRHNGNGDLLAVPKAFATSTNMIKAPTCADICADIKPKSVSKKLTKGTCCGSMKQYWPSLRIHRYKSCNTKCANYCCCLFNV